MESVLVEGSDSTKASKVEMNLSVWETMKGKCGWGVVRERRGPGQGWGQVLAAWACPGNSGEITGWGLLRELCDQSYMEIVYLWSPGALLSPFQ